MGQVRRIRRPATLGTPEFDLAYVRSGPKGCVPVVVIPGGPGLTSVLPYRGLRRQCAFDGLDVIMVEHRGVGLSRRDTRGVDLPFSAMWIDEVLDDIDAVLAQESVDRVFLAGSSYGSYLASSFAAKYPERIEGVLLDSALQAADDTFVERQAIRALFWDGDSRAAELVQELTARGEDQRILLDVVRAGYELGGMPVALNALERRLAGKLDPVWLALQTYASRSASIAAIPGYFDFAVVGAIGFRELEYAPAPDGLPLDPALTYSLIAEDFPSFAGEPYDLSQYLPTFDWPFVLLVGDRDLRTPPVIAERTASLVPRPEVVTISNGHSALDTHPLAFEKTMKLLVTGRHRKVKELERELDLLPRRGLGADFAKSLEVLTGLYS